MDLTKDEFGRLRHKNGSVNFVVGPKSKGNKKITEEQKKQAKSRRKIEEYHLNRDLEKEFEL